MNRLAAILLAATLCLNGCANDKQEVPQLDPVLDSNFPKAIGEIIVNKCATAGCHNNASFQAAAGLNLSTWDKMLNGSRSGAVVIPFASGQSSLFFICNTYADLGVQLLPTMPINSPKLSREEVISLKAWIDNGAPAADGKIFFKENAGKKLLITNQGCDLMAIYDLERDVVARYLPIGASTTLTESPHYVKVSPDGKSYLVVYYNSTALEHYDAATDSLIGTATLPMATGWNVVAFTPDNKTAIVSNLTETQGIGDGGGIQMVDLTTYTLTGPYIYLAHDAHGIMINSINNKLYVSNQYSNYLWRMELNDPVNTIEPVSLSADKSIVNSTQSLNPHEMIYIPGTGKYFVTCDYSDEVRVMDATTDTLIAVIPTPEKPLEFAYSTKRGLLFVTCNETPSVIPATKGSVYAIDVNTLQVVKHFETGFYEPHGITIDDAADKLFVISRNIAANGPAPHHASECGGRNGFMTIINLMNMQVLNKRHELSVDPYAATIIQ
ncbi:MAG: hypothetical protein IPO27_15315 [Bacteroidetes bacterium]|nr:hypothetical protein [Bacteroidota bacterium]